MERRNYDIRRHVLQYDDVMNQQREIIYGQRREVLEGGDMRQRILDMRNTVITDAVNRHVGDEGNPDTWNISALSEELEHLCIDRGGVQQIYDGLKELSKKDFIDQLDKRAGEIYATREKMWNDAGRDMREFERAALLRAVDIRWR